MKKDVYGMLLELKDENVRLMLKVEKAQAAFDVDESKRLENEWLDRIRAKHRVTQYRELLQGAFASPPVPDAPVQNQ